MLFGVLTVVYAVMSLITFVMFGIDKKRAMNQEWRIKEATLLTMCLLGGSIGGLLGMRTFRHKTKKLKFTIGVPLLLVVNIICFFVIGLV